MHTSCSTVVRVQQSLYRGPHLLAAISEWPLLCITDSSDASRIGGTMTLDWQVLLVAFAAVSLRLVVISIDTDVARAEDDQLRLERSGASYPLQAQASVQAK